MAPEPPFTRSSAHPRAYGNFARLLGKYVRDEKALTLADAVHRLSGLPATNLELRDRGLLAPGMFADVVVFDPRTIADKATFEKPHQYAVGVRDVLVNGAAVLRNGEHTNAQAGPGALRAWTGQPLERVFPGVRASSTTAARQKRYRRSGDQEVKRTLSSEKSKDLLTRPPYS